MHGYGLSGLKFYADQELLLQLMSLLWTCPANDVTGHDDPKQVLSLLVVLTVGGHVLSLDVGTYPKGERGYSGKHSAPWIHVSGFHLLETGQ
jgi:hypothetical protein